MKWLLLVLALSAGDQVCKKREWRCIERCNADHTIGSMDHLNCKQRCHEDYLVCREE